MKSVILIILCWCSFTLAGYTQNRVVIAKNVEIKTDQKSFLYCSKATDRIGDWKMQAGENARWQGSSEIKWKIEVVRDDSFEMFLNAWVPEGSKDIKIAFNTGSETVSFRLQPTKGLKIQDRNFQRIEYDPQVHLKKGTYEVSLKSENVDNGVHVMDLRALELEPVSAVKKINADIEKAVKSRASTEWLAKAGYGLMFHFTSQSVNPDGSSLPYERAIDQFDVDKFAKMVSETGAGYIIFTIGHAQQYCPAPIASWEKCHPGMTTKRDLIAEIADALNAKGIRSILYMNSYGTAKFNRVDNNEFYKTFTDILKEFGDRYKEKVAGYWFDCWYQIFEGFPDIPIEDFFKVCKTGNKDRIICLNSWIYPSVSPWQDYWAGEVSSPVDLPVNGHMVGGPVPDLRYQALLIMEPYWVQQRADHPDPRFTASELSQYIHGCMDNGGAVTINMGIHQDGTVGEKALDVMKLVRKMVRGN
jgi:Alpha-L-fucosidase